jgi:phosphopantetheinyl transferase (holo-ACP synthase)
VAKALGLSAWSFRDVEVVSGSGPPSVRLSGAVAARAGELAVEVSVSLTHTRRDAAAVAIALGGRDA